MNSYDSLRKHNKRSLSAALVLAVCVALSAVMMFSRLAHFVTRDTIHYIPLTTERGGTRITVTQDGQPRAAKPALPTPEILAATPFMTAAWFQTHDENTVWSGETDIEIFRVSYENGGGKVTVNSENGDKLLAPGTENTYSFALENTGTYNLEYAMSMEAYFSDGDHVIPVVASVCDRDGNYLAGSADSAVDVLELNQVSDAGVLKPGYMMPYTLYWQWPFEVDDEYDTMLGNLAVDQDIALTIVINTVATYTPEPGGGDPVDTGDTANLMLYSVLLTVSLAALLALLLFKPRWEEKNA